MAKLKKEKSRRTGPGQKRKERRFSTSATFMPLWVAIVGIASSLVLGAGVWGLWILDPAVDYGAYLVAVGGAGLGVALWFGQAAESAVFVGDAGIAVEDGKEIARVAWFDMRSIKVEGGKMVVEGSSLTIKFLLGANLNAASAVLKEAATRVPDVVDVDTAVTSKLPDPAAVKGFRKDVEDHQVTGVKCAQSGKPIHLEEDARLCPRCGQIFHKESVPELCTSCEEKLAGRTLLA